MVPVYLNIPQTEGQNGFPRVPGIKGLIPQILPGVNPVLIIEEYRIEGGDGGTFRGNPIPEGYGFEH